MLVETCKREITRKCGIKRRQLDLNEFLLVPENSQGAEQSLEGFSNT